MNSPLLRSILLTIVVTLTSVSTTLAQQSVARQWSETQLSCIRKYFAKPTVHARHLSHVSIAMYDAWAVYDNEAQPYFLGQTWGGFNCPFNGIPMPADGDIIAAQEKALSYAAYRTLWNRYTIFAPGANLLTIQGYLNDRMASLGYDTGITSIDYSDGDPAKLGNYIAAKLQEFALQDGSNQQNNYNNIQYQPLNGQLEPAFPGNPHVVDPNRWQPLVLSQCIDQNNIPIECPPGTGTPALSHEWGNVTPFALRADQADTLQRDGLDWKVYLDPGAPPYLDTTLQSGLYDSFFKWGYVTNIIWHSFHNNDDGVMIDASPNSIGGLNITAEDQLPVTFEDYQGFYNLFEGGVNDPGHAINPVTGAPYETQMVPRKDFTRVLSQYWADGPSSETPPGHWFKLFNEVEDKMDLLGIEKRWMGEESVSDLEWDVKGYFALGGGIHDAAIACWGTKGYYDYTRPIMAIRWMGVKGQSTDPNLPHYHPAGLPLIPGYIELVQEGDELAGTNNEHVNKIKIYSWRGPFAATGVDGAGWLLAENWWTYQTAGFVTPPFAGYYSGHSTYSRTGAEIMTLITGDEYFPGGMAEYVATQDEYLLADDGPSTTVKLQWATYRDASDQCSVSRIYGGLHPPQDDIPGRKVGLIVGPQAVDKANEFIHADPAHVAVSSTNAVITDNEVGSPWSLVFTFDKAMNTAIEPQSILLTTIAADNFIATGGSWTDEFHYQANYTLVDNNVTIENIVFSVQGAQDLSGITNMPAVSSVITIDTQNPTAQGTLTGNETIITEADVTAGATIHVLLDYSESMNTSLQPTFDFSSPEANASFVLDNSSAWTSSTTFHAVFNVVDVDAAIASINLEVSAATDSLGNAQLILMLNDALSIDTQAPNAAITLSHPVISDADAGSTFTATITFDSPMNTGDNPMLTFAGLSLPENLLFVEGTWASDTQFIVSYTILDGNIESNNIDLGSAGGSDLNGNLQVPALLNDGLIVDTRNPLVLEVSAAQPVLSDNATTSPVAFTISFDDDMSEASMPMISFAGSSSALTPVIGSGTWLDAQTYSVLVDFADNNEEVSDMSVSVSGAADDAGNLQEVDFEATGLFIIDTRNPILTEIATNTAIINDGTIGAETFSVTLTFDEAMDETSVPMISFDPIVSNLIPSANSGWQSSTVYIARYDVTAAIASQSDITINATMGGNDIAGNEMIGSTTLNAFDIDVTLETAEQLVEKDWLLYPNPASGDAVRLAVPSDIHIENIRLYSAVGALFSDLNVVSDNSAVVINLNGLADGIYYVRIQSSGMEKVLPLQVIH
ncbi:MAG: DUF6851 domain-containing protein [Flavobacteriales bacterium]|jgi:hypothetical protein